MTNVVTNIISAASQAAPFISINWTILLSVISVGLMAMGSIIKIFSINATNLANAKIKEEDLMASSHLKNLENKISENFRKIDLIKDQIKDQITESKIQIAKMEVETKNNSTSLENIKADNREIVQRLDDLLKQLLEWISSSDN